MVVLREDEPQCPNIFQPSLVLHLVMFPRPKLLIWLKPGLGVRELLNGMGTGWAVIPSIWAKQPTTSIFFSILLYPLPYQTAPVICNCVCMCECIFLSFHGGRYGKEKGFGIGIAIQMNWESVTRTSLSPCFNLQTNVDDPVSEQKSPTEHPCAKPFIFFSAFTHSISLAFSWFEAREKRCDCIWRGM